MGLKPSRSISVCNHSRQQSKRIMKNVEKRENDEDEIYEINLIKLRSFSRLRNHHYELVDGLNLMLLDTLIQNHDEFPMQIQSLKRSGAFIIMHASENYDKFATRLEDVNDDIMVLTHYIVSYLVKI